MKTTIYYIRHSLKLGGQDLDLIDGYFGQRINERVSLSVLGEEKAKEMASIDELQNIDVIFSSEFVRAIQTAKYIALNNHLKIHTKYLLGERKIGDVIAFANLRKRKKLSYKTLQMRDENFKNKGGESRKEVNIRMTKVLKQILTRNEGKRIAVVCHAGCMRALFANWCKIVKLSSNDYRLAYDNVFLDFTAPSVFKLEFDSTDINSLTNLEQVYVNVEAHEIEKKRNAYYIRKNRFMQRKNNYRKRSYKKNKEDVQE